jgi:hypothetical protein
VGVEVTGSQPAVSPEQTETSSEPELDGVEPDLDGVDPDLGGVDPDLDGVEPDLDGVEPDLDAVEPDLDAVEPGDAAVVETQAGDGVGAAPGADQEAAPGADQEAVPGPDQEAAPAAEPDAAVTVRPGWRRLVPWLIALAYMLIAVVVTWRIWRDPATMAPTNGRPAVQGDVLDDFWFMRYAATAVSHGHLPALVSTTLNWPQGVNMMWNNTELVAGVVLAPVTWVWGPIASLAVLLTLGFAGSAIAMMVVARRWGAGLTGAALAGAIYGFSPALMVAAEDHYQLQFAVLPPLIVDAALRLAAGRGRPARWGVLTGAWLGVLVAAQLFLGSELLVLTALAGAIIAVLALVQRPMVVVRAWRSLIAGTLAAVAVAGVLCGRAVWVQLHGPLKQAGTPWRISKYGNPQADLVTAPFAVLLHGDFSAFLGATHQFRVETYAYLGWPIVIALVVLPILFWRDARVRTCALAFWVLELIGMGGHRTWVLKFFVQGDVLPWHYLVQLPLLSDVVVPRLSILTAGPAALVIGFAADHALAAIRRSGRWRGPVLAAATVGALAAVIVPILPDPLPAAAVIQPQAGFIATLDRLHLRPDAPVLFLPMQDNVVEGWLSLTNAPVSMVGGSCMVPAANGRATACQDANAWTEAERFTALGIGRLSDIPARPGPSLAQAIRALRQWHPEAVVYFGQDHAVAHFLTELLGLSSDQNDGVIGWRLTAGGSPLHPPRLTTSHRGHRPGHGHA